MTIRARQVGRASDQQAEMQLQELTRAVNELGGDVEGVQRTLPDVIEDIEKELDDRIPIPTEPPTIPTNLVAIPAFQMFILKWDRSVAEIVDGYIISFSTSEDGTSWSEWEEIVLPNISVFTHTGLDSNLYYRYRVLTYNRAGRSLWSNITEAQKPIKVSLSEQIIDEHNWMEIWDRAEAISEDGKLLAEKIAGFINRAQLNQDIIDELEEVGVIGEEVDNIVGELKRGKVFVEGNMTSFGARSIYDATKDWISLAEQHEIDTWAGFKVVVYDINHEMQVREITSYSQTHLQVSPDWGPGLEDGMEYAVTDSETMVATYSRMRQTAEEIVSEVGRVEGVLNNPDSNMWYSSIKQVANSIVSEVARIEGALGSPNSNMWYSSIKQTADEISQTVAKLNGSDPVQFSTIQQLANQITSLVADLSEGGETYTKISQNAGLISSIAVDVNGNKQDISAVAQTASEISSTVAKKEFTEPLVSGTITTGNTTGVKWTQDTTKNWGNLAKSLGISDWKNLYLRFTSGENEEKVYQITGTSGATIFFSPPTENNLTAGDGYEIVTLETVASSTFQQHANMINQRVVAKDRYGNVINSAQIQVGLVDSQGYILLDASDIFVPGTVHVFDRNPGSAASGQVTIDSGGINVRDGMITVENEHGITTIDGTKNIFKIAKTGILLAGTSHYIPHEGTGLPAMQLYVDAGYASYPFFVTYGSASNPTTMGVLPQWTRPNASTVRVSLGIGTENDTDLYVRYYLFEEEAF